MCDFLIDAFVDGTASNRRISSLGFLENWLVLQANSHLIRNTYFFERAVGILRQEVKHEFDAYLVPNFRFGKVLQFYQGIPEDVCKKEVFFFFFHFYLLMASSTLFFASYQAGGPAL